MKKVLLVIGCIILIVVAAVVIFGATMNSQIKKFDNETLVNISEVKDGVYDGEAKAGPVKVKVEVTVKNGKIQQLLLKEHKNGMGKDAEVIVDTIKEKNSLDVDTVSGATMSSKTIKAAVNHALGK